MSRGRLALAALAVVLTAPGEAAETLFGAEYGVESLDVAGPNWRSTVLSATHTRDDGSLRAEWQGVERFGIRDSQWKLSGGARAHGLALTVDFGGSQDHRILPKAAAGIDLGAPVGGGWVVHLGARRSRFTEDTATALFGGLEFYRGDWRLSYSVIDSRLSAGGPGVAHVGQVDRYYGDGSRIGLIAATGSEATRIDPSTVIVADVRSYALVGRHWLSRAWCLTYVWGRTEQGDFYTRQGPALGLLFRL